MLNSQCTAPALQLFVCCIVIAGEKILKDQICLMLFERLFQAIVKDASKRKSYIADAWDILKFIRINKYSAVYLGSKWNLHRNMRWMARAWCGQIVMKSKDRLDAKSPLMVHWGY